MSADRKFQKIQLAKEEEQARTIKRITKISTAPAITGLLAINAKTASAQEPIPGEGPGPHPEPTDPVIDIGGNHNPGPGNPNEICVYHKNVGPIGPGEGRCIIDTKPCHAQVNGWVPGPCPEGSIVVTSTPTLEPTKIYNPRATATPGRIGETGGFESVAPPTNMPEVNQVGGHSGLDTIGSVIFGVAGVGFLVRRKVVEVARKIKGRLSPTKQQ